MSHDLKTPLNAIIGFAQLLARDPLLSRRQRSDVDVILRSGNDLLKMIEDLQEFSTIEAGGLSRNETDFSLTRLLDDTEALFRSRCDDKGLHLAVNRESGLPDFLFGDGAKLKKILVNLLSNAIRYTPYGRIDVHVKSVPANQMPGPGLDLGPGPDHGSDGSPGDDIPLETRSTNLEIYRLRIEVADSGVGMSQEELSRIFDPNSRAETGPRLAGSGLGLFISRTYAGLLGGEIQVQSQKGQGSRFCVTVVMKKGRPVAVESESVPGRVIRLVPESGPVRILVADDDPVNQTLLKALLTPAGFEVFAASDGREAVTLFEQSRPHAVFMDLRMPGMDGYEAAQRIKSSDQGRGIPVIALTASTFEEARQGIEQAGMDGCIQKPVHGPQVFDVIQQYLGVRYVHEQGRGDTTAAAAALPVFRLPDRLRPPLKQAVADGDMIRFAELLAPFESSHPDLTALLGRLAENFNYSEILSILDRPASPNDTQPEKDKDE